MPEGFRFHDLRHTGHTLSTRSGAALKDTMVRAGQSSEKAALIYQHSDDDRQREVAVGLDPGPVRDGGPPLEPADTPRGCVRAARTVSADTALQLVREAHGELDTGFRPSAAFLDASGMVAPTAAYTAAGAHMPSAAQQFAALAERTAARLVRGRGRRAVAGAVRAVSGRCRALR